MGRGIINQNEISKLAETMPNPNFAQNSSSIPDSSKILVSCKPRKCEHEVDRDCWVVDSWAPEPPCKYTSDEDKRKYCVSTLLNNYCDGDAFDQKSGEVSDAMNWFKDVFNPNESNYDSLMSSCYFRNNAAVGAVKQFNCSTNDVTRGCYGSPPVITTSTLSGIAEACSNDSMIPQSSRCTERKDANGNPVNDGVCEDFPYSCGTQYGSNRLWIPT